MVSVFVKLYILHNIFSATLGASGCKELPIARIAVTYVMAFGLT